jgi:ubiquinone/menaquinone biosynthesis C-methylase UbiE
MNSGEKKEIRRLGHEYTRRDRSGLLEIYTYSNPAFLFHMQEREWAVLRLLRSERISLNGMSILEVGCGTGHILQRFLELGVTEATGIDLMESRICAGKKRYPNLRLVQGNAAKLPYKNNQFDLVMQFMCLSSVLDPYMRHQIAEEMWRVLRPGGIILSYDPRLRPFVSRFIYLTYRTVTRILRIFIPGQKKEPSWREEPIPSIRTKQLGIKEIKNLYSPVQVSYRSVSLGFDLARVAGKSFFLATLLSWIGRLRTHYLALVRKPS